MIRVALLATLLTHAAQAEGIVTPEAFQSLSQGKTLHFNFAGQHFGSEQYFNDRKSLWKPAQGDCDYGYWFPKDQQICFAYESWPDPICWLFVERSGTYFARQTDNPDGVDEIELVARDDQPLNCPGPRTGS